jgi:hypothetical protein
MDSFRTEQERAVQKLTEEQLVNLHHMRIEKTDEGTDATVSHWILKYVVPVVGDKAYMDAHAKLRPVSNWIMRNAWAKFVNMSLEKKALALANAAKAGVFDEVNREWFEDIFAARLLSAEGIEWTIRDCWPQDVVLEKRQAPLPEWRPFNARCTRSEPALPEGGVSTMEVGVLYAKFPNGFPMVDAVWKDEQGEIWAVQVTTARKHPKAISVLEDLLDKLKLLDKVVHIVYLMMPVHAKIAATQQHNPSFYWSGSSTFTEDQKKFICANVKFHILFPPEDLSAKESRMSSLVVRPPFRGGRRSSDDSSDGNDIEPAAAGKG